MRIERAARAAACVAALVCAGDNPGAAQSSAPVRVGLLASLSEAPFLLAHARGYFRAEGLEIEIVRFQNTADMVAPLATGQLEVGAGAPTVAFFSGILRGIPLKLVADKGRNSPGHGFNALLVRKDLVDGGRVRTLADIKGLKIGSPSRHSPVEVELDFGLRKVGLGLDDVSIEMLPLPNMIPALANKAIDGAMTLEPQIALAQARGIAVRLMGADEMFPDYQIAGILFGAEFQRTREDAARRWMVAYLRGIRDFLDGLAAGGETREALFHVLAESMDIKDRALYARMVMPGFNADGYLHLDSMKETVAWFVARGALRQGPKLADFVDYRYLDHALERLGRRGQAQSVPR